MKLFLPLLIASSIALLTTLTGCTNMQATWMGKELPFNYTSSPVPTSAYAQTQQKIALETKDARPNTISPKTISVWDSGEGNAPGPAFDDLGVQYHATQNFSDIVNQALVTNFTQAGYQIVNAAPKKVQVDILNSSSRDVTEDIGFSTYSVATVNLQVQVLNQVGKTLWEKNYVGQGKVNLGLGGVTKRYASTNIALNNAIIMVLQDPQFKNAIAK